MASRAGRGLARINRSGGLAGTGQAATGRLFPGVDQAAALVTSFFTSTCAKMTSGSRCNAS